MKILLTGAGGQLGQALCNSLPPGLELIATGRKQLDLADAQACRAAVEQHRPHRVLPPVPRVVSGLPVAVFD